MTVAAPTPRRSARPLHARLDELTRAIRARQRCSDHDKVQIGLYLHEIDRLQLYALGGHASLSAYGREEHGWSSGHTSNLKGVGRGCVEMPPLREALRTGELSWSKARELVKIATPETIEELLEKARPLDSDELRDLVIGRARRHRRTLEWTDEQIGWVDDAVLGVRRELGRAIPLAEALAEVCKRALSGSDQQRLGGPNMRVVLHHCPTCEATTREGPAGPLPVVQAALEAALCDAQVVDLTAGGDGRPRRTVPAAVRREVFARSRERCAVPGCRNRLIHFHHEDGAAAGHDPARCVALCEAHHLQRHLGYLRLEKRDGLWDFSRADGVFLGREGDRVKATVGALAAASATELAAASDLAAQALVKLDFHRRDAEALVRHVLAREPGRAWSVDDLVGEALRAHPLPG
jgi:hypothetical protein